jgi:hypothetical protein
MRIKRVGYQSGKILNLYRIAYQLYLTKNQCCGSGMFIPDTEISISEFRPMIKKALDPGSGSSTNNLSILNTDNFY